VIRCGSQESTGMPPATVRRAYLPDRYLRRLAGGISVLGRRKGCEADDLGTTGRYQESTTWTRWRDDRPGPREFGVGFLERPEDLLGPGIVVTPAIPLDLGNRGGVCRRCISDETGLAGALTINHGISLAQVGFTAW